MNLESGLYVFLCDSAAVSELITSRIYPLLLPDDAVLPALTYQRISTVTDQTLNGIVGMTTVRMQFDTWAEDYATSKRLADAVNSELEAFAGTLPNGVRVANVMLDVQFDLFESQSLRYRVSSDYLIQFLR